jgi:hypothetical protein
MIFHIIYLFLCVNKYLFCFIAAAVPSCSSIYLFFLPFYPFEKNYSQFRYTLTLYILSCRHNTAAEETKLYFISHDSILLFIYISLPGIRESIKNPAPQNKNKTEITSRNCYGKASEKKKNHHFSFWLFQFHSIYLLFIVVALLWHFNETNNNL